MASVWLLLCYIHTLSWQMCSLVSRFSRAMVDKMQNRRTPNSRWKAETDRQDRIKMFQNMTKEKGQWFREESHRIQLCDPVP